MSLGRRLAWLTFALVPGALAQLASCSSSDPAVAPAAAEAGEPPTPTEAGPKKPVDAGLDTATPEVPRQAPVLPSCLGETRPLRSAGAKAYVTVNMSPPTDAGAGLDAGDAARDTGPATTTSRGDFLVDFGANASSIDLGGFMGSTPPTPTNCFGDASVPGASCTFPHFDFFGPWGTVALSTADYGVLFSTYRQSGTIGTDFLANYPFTLDYENQRIWRGSKTAFCSDAQLLAAGFSPIPTGGFFVDDPSKLRPLSEVLVAPDAATTRGFVVPNVPTVPITIGGVSALTQLDTGYDDRVTRHSININQQLLEQLKLKDAGLLERVESADLFLTTCVPGLSQKAEAYRLRKGTAVDFIAQGGQVGRHDVGNFVFVKDPTGAARCGGIDTWTVPAAQLGASFLYDSFAVVFDPITSRVWIPK